MIVMNVEETEEDNKRVRGRRVLAIFLSALFVVGVLFLLFYLYSYYRQGVFNRFNSHINVLVVGTDKKQGFAGQADLVLVFSYYPATRRMAIVAVPRNTRVKVNYNGAEVYDTIANIYAVKKDVLYLRKQVELLTGLSIPNYVVVNLRGFLEIVDLLGGVDVFTGRQMNYRDKAGKVLINIPFGHFRFNGKKSLDFVRYRDKAAMYTEYDRMARAMEFCLEVLKKQKVIIPFVKQPRMFSRLLSKVKTNMTLRDVFGGLKYLQDFDKTRVTSMVIRGKKYGSYIKPDYVASRLDVRKMMMNLKVPYIGMAKKVDVQILNGSGVPGLARYWKIRLRNEKFNVVEAGNHFKNDLRYTIVLDKKGYPDQARRIARYIGTRQVYSKIDLVSTSDITVILGKDAHR